MKTTVLYHAGCYDGFCAAWVLWHVFPEAEFIPVSYGQPPPPDNKIEGADLYIVDFCYSLEVMKGLIDKADHVKVLDHHETAEQAMKGLMREDFANPPYVVFDSSKSGGRLTWDFVMRYKMLRLPFPSCQDIPWLVSYTEDRDLWEWKLPNSKAINAMLRTYPIEPTERGFQVWETLERNSRNDLLMREFVAAGAGILKSQERVVEDHTRKAGWVELAGYKVPCINATTLISEIGQHLCKGYPFSATYFDSPDGKRIWSLRSDRSGVNVAEIAEKYGGGGHKHAAGFSSVIPFGAVWCEVKHEAREPSQS